MLCCKLCVSENTHSDTCSEELVNYARVGEAVQMNRHHHVTVEHLYYIKEVAWVPGGGGGD
jgi:hypothetical protein